MKPDTITINIPVRIQGRAVKFYTELGLAPHPVFRGPDCQCMVLTEHIQVMVHLEGSLQHFTPKPIAEPGVVLCLNCVGQAQVDTRRG